VQVGGGVVDQGLLAEDAQQRRTEQQRRKQRQQGVVGERRGVVGDLVAAEPPEGALEVRRLKRGTGLAAVVDSRPVAGRAAQTRRLLPNRLPMP
jgi:hypothetical protein